MKCIEYCALKGLHTDCIVPCDDGILISKRDYYPELAYKLGLYITRETNIVFSFKRVLMNKDYQCLDGFFKNHSL